jgi:hypothetical protein
MFPVRYKLNIYILFWNVMECNMRYLNLAVVRHMTVQAIKLVLQPELPLTGHNLLYEPGLKEA